MKCSSTILLFIFLFTSCKEKVDLTKTLLVEVGSERLYLEDFQEMIPPSVSKEDSANIVNHHIDKWIKNSLFLKEARGNVDGQEINLLVDNYKKSLLVHTYESNLMEEKLDTLIRQEEVDQYYQKYNSDFILVEPAYLFNFAKVFKSDKSKMRKIWQEDEWDQVKELCLEKSYWSHIEDGTWITASQINEYLPQELSSSVKFTKGSLKTLEKDTLVYFAEVKDVLKKGKQAPKSVVKNQIEKIILHKRTLDLLEKEKTKLYEKAISSKTIVKFSEN